MAYLNLLWILFTILGLGVFGVFPALTATFGILREWILGRIDLPMFQSFWALYKKDFVKSNLLGLIVMSLGFLLIVDLQFFNASESRMLNLFAIPILALTILYLFTSFYIFPTFIHYDLKIIEVLKHAFLLMIINPLETLLMVIGLITVGYLFFKFQGFIPLFGISVFASVIIMPAMQAFEKVNIKQASQ